MRASLLVSFALPSLTLVSVACSDSDGPATVDATPTVACTPVAGTTFEPDSTVGTKVNVHGVFAGGAAWLSYNVQEGGSNNLDVAMVRVGCDGTTLSQTTVTTRTGNNDTSAPLATDGDRVMVAWSASTDQSPDNLDMYTRAFTVDGSPVADDAPFYTDLGGTVAMVADWMPGVAADSEPGDGFVIVGTRARPDLERFGAFVQRTDGDGVPVGATLDPSIVPMVSHNFPAAAHTSAGTLVAYLDTPDTGDDTLVWTLLGAGNEVLTPTVPASIVDEAATGAPPALVGLDDHAFAVANTDSNGAEAGGTQKLWLRRLPGGSVADAVEIAAGTSNNYYPAIASNGVDGGAVAWLRFGATRQLWVARFAQAGSTVTTSVPVQITTERAVAQYKPAIVHLAGDHYLVAWHEYDGENYRLLAQVVELPN